MNELILDFETYFAQDFSLKAMPTVLYVRDERFRVHGVGVQLNDEQPRWITDPTNYFATIDWANTTVIGHNLLFDAMILVERYEVRAAEYRDTRSMANLLLPSTLDKGLDVVARTLGHKGKLEDGLKEIKGVREPGEDQLERLGLYCLQDIEATRHVYKRLWPLMPADERVLSHLTTRMGVESDIQLDQEALVAEIQLQTTKRQERIAKSGVAESVLTSNDQFYQLLSEYVDPDTIPMKQGKAQLIPAFSKNDAGWAEFKADHPELKEILDGREAAKSNILVKRAERYLAVAKCGPGTLPMAYDFAGAKTHRWNGTGGLNVSNMPSLRISGLRKCLTAPPGYVIHVCDLSQIELRLQLWLSGAHDKIPLLDLKPDLYTIAAANVYGIAPSEVTKHQRQIGKILSLGAQYGMSYQKYRLFMAGGPMGMPPLPLTEEEAYKHIKTYRNDNPATTTTWRKLGAALHYIRDGIEYQIGPITTGKECLHLPNGTEMDYFALEMDEEGQWAYGLPKRRTFIQGPKLLENCVAEGTLVLTDKGWKPIESVTLADQVFDGVELTNHKGLLRSPVQACVNIDGVLMTPDHKVMTHADWQPASQLQKPNGPAIRYVDRDPTFAQQWQNLVLEVPMRMRPNDDQMRNRCHPRGKARGDAELRVRDKETNGKGENKARDGSAPSLLGMAQYARPLQAAYASGMEELRRAWNLSLRAMDPILRGVLGRHGAYLRAWAYVGPSGQRRGLHPGELPLGKLQDPSPKQTKFVEGQRPLPIKRNRDQPVNPLLPTEKRLDSRPTTKNPILRQQPRPPNATNRSQTSSKNNRVHNQCAPREMEKRPVYDIVNAGPRARFVVLGASGPFIVHNCVQALARIPIGDAMIAIERETELKVAGATHDEILALGPESRADENQAAMHEIMTRRIPWAPDLPLQAEGGFSPRYEK